MTREIPLTQGLVTLVDDEDYDRVMAAGKWYAHRNGRVFYARRNVRLPDGRQGAVLLHAFLTGFAVTDHVNRDGLDNRRANLREATHAENVRNARRRSDNQSGFKGVTWHKQCRKWNAQIRTGADRRHLGLFSTPDAAARAYDEAAREMFGEFAGLNFPGAGERGAA